MAGEVARNEDGTAVHFKDYCWDIWTAHYGTSPPWGPRDFAILAEARSRMDTETVARIAWLRFTLDDGPFYVGHEPVKFLSSLSRWVAIAARRPSIVRKEESFPGARRAAAMSAIMREVMNDDTIPEPMKRDEMSRRWKEIPQDV